MIFSTQMRIRRHWKSHPGCFSSISAQASTVSIDVINFAFNPNPTVINLGDTVDWIWQSNTHSTTSVAGSAESWDSGVHNNGFSFDHTFNTLGTFNYYDKIDGFDNGDGTAGGMSGTIVVQAPPPPPSGNTVTVDVINFAFDPNPVTISVGDSVDWVWLTNNHSTTSVAGSVETWDSSVHSNGFSFTHQFTTVGSFPYYDKINGFDNGNGTAGGQSGTVIVQALAAQTPEPSTAQFAFLALPIVFFARLIRRRRSPANHPEY